VVAPFEDVVIVLGCEGEETICDWVVEDWPVEAVVALPV
jgi:hypothetical protein